MPHLDTTLLSSLISHAPLEHIEAHMDDLLNQVFDENGSLVPGVEITNIMENCFKPFVAREEEEFDPSDRLFDNLELCRDMVEHAFLTHDEPAIPQEGYCRLISWGIHTSPFMADQALPDRFFTLFAEQLRHAGLLDKRDSITFLNKLVPVQDVDVPLEELRKILLCGAESLKKQDVSFSYHTPDQKQKSSAHLLVAIIHSDQLALVNEDLDEENSAYKETLQMDMRMESHLMVSSWFKDHAPDHIDGATVKSLLVPDYLTDSARFLLTHIASCNVAEAIAKLNDEFNGDFEAEIDLQCDLKQGRLKASYQLDEYDTLHPINTEILTIRKTLFLPNEMLDINDAIEQILLHAWEGEPHDGHTDIHQTKQAFH